MLVARERGLSPPELFQPSSVVDLHSPRVGAIPAALYDPAGAGAGLKKSDGSFLFSPRDLIHLAQAQDPKGHPNTRTAPRDCRGQGG